MINRLVSNFSMKIFETRRQRLKKIIADDFNGNQAEFSRKTGIKAPQINRWLSTSAADPRNITEKSARKIEQGTGKPSGWLDAGTDFFPTEYASQKAEQERKPYLSGIRELSTISARDKDIEEIIDLIKRTNHSGVAMVLKAARDAYAERPMSKTAK